MVSMKLPLTLAASLYKAGALTLEKAARLAHQNLEAFIETLGKLNIPVAHYSVDELHDELKSFK
jgi:predicted HTH domain antitoxin